MNLTTSSRKTGRFEVRNTAKAARASARHTGSILVTLPFNDYYRGPGRVFTGSPKVFRAPRFHPDGRVTVLADKRSFEVVSYAYRFSGRSNEPICRAQLMFATR